MISAKYTQTGEIGLETTELLYIHMHYASLSWTSACGNNGSAVCCESQGVAAPVLSGQSESQRNSRDLFLLRGFALIVRGYP